MQVMCFQKVRRLFVVVGLGCWVLPAVGVQAAQAIEVTPAGEAVPVLESAHVIEVAPAREASGRNVSGGRLLANAVTSTLREPLALDLTDFYNVKIDIIRKKSGATDGRLTFDGLPFFIGDSIRLFGETSDKRGEKLPYSVKGIPVNKKFEEMYLLHHATWPDVEGQVVAYVCWNYADETEVIFPISYGVHIRDWFNLPSYEKEAISDPDTTICWRNPPVTLKAPVRMFKTKLVNPSPEKEVKSIDFVSARNLANYNLLGVTLANSKDEHSQKFVGDRNFDSKLTITVVDDVTGKPIEGVLLDPGMFVEGEGVVGTPLLTSAKGEGVIPFPSGLTASISVRVMKKGYQSTTNSWSSPTSTTHVFRLTPEKSPKPTDPFSSSLMPSGSGTTITREVRTLESREIKPDQIPVVKPER